MSIGHCLEICPYNTDASTNFCWTKILHKKILPIWPCPWDMVAPTFCSCHKEFHMVMLPMLMLNIRTLSSTHEYGQTIGERMPYDIGNDFGLHCEHMEEWCSLKHSRVQISYDLKWMCFKIPSCTSSHANKYLWL